MPGIQLGMGKVPPQKVRNLFEIRSILLEEPRMTLRLALVVSSLMIVSQVAAPQRPAAPGVDPERFMGQEVWPVPILDNASVAPTPPMGFSLWYAFGDNPGPSDELTRELADALVSTGLRDAGYVYLLAFDGAWWSAAVTPGRDLDGNMLVDKQRWPNGIRAVSDYIHGKGLKVAGYTDLGELGYCLPQQRGMRNHEQQDADKFAEWDWDYLKIDDHGPGNYYNACAAVFHNNRKRPIVVSLSTPMTFPFEFAPRVANMWRVGGDLSVDLGRVRWKDIVREFDNAGAFWWAQAPGRWNDLDILAIGVFGITDLEARSELSMWAIRGAPLLVSTDIRPPYLGSSGPVPKITETQLGLLKNEEVIAIDQDPLGASGRPVRITRSADTEVDVKPLGTFTSGENAVLLLNRSETAQDIRVEWADLGIRTENVVLRDVWQHKYLKSSPDGYLARGVPPHGAVMLRVKGVFDWSRPREYEAESSYNRFTGLAQVRMLNEEAARDVFSGKIGATSGAREAGDAAVVGVGDGPGNTLQLNGVATPKRGLYLMRILYASPTARDAFFLINGAEHMHIVFPSTGGALQFRWKTYQVQLEAGDNTVQISNPKTLAPNIDKVQIEETENHAYTKAGANPKKLVE
jgi:alpha-galactosidase